MWPESEDFEAHCNYEEAIAESRAQIEFCESRGMRPSHVDSHMGAVYGLNAEGQWVQGAYHQRKGLARFEFRPSYIRYVYDAGVGDMLVDLAVIASE